MKTAFQNVIERARSALRGKYLQGIQFRAEPLFDAEVSLIRTLGFEEALVQFADYGDQLRQRDVKFHLIGSGGSSVILYVLGMSQVNPLRHNTCFQRLWMTSSGKPPILQIVADSLGNPGVEAVVPPPCVSTHPMTVLEAIPNRLVPKIGAIKATNLDQATLASLHAGDVDDIFQLHSERARWLLDQIRPVNIEELACVTALEQISHSQAEIVITYLEQYRDIITTRYVTGRRPFEEAVRRLPILFQEHLMYLLRRVARLEWNDTYPFIQAAASGRVDEQHGLGKATLEAMRHNGTENSEDLLRSLIDASRWAVCRAHHVANALTSYKAAFCRTHRRMEFERVRMQIAESVEKGQNGG